MATVKHGGEALKFASENLHENSEIVMAAVKQLGLALKFSSKDI